MTGSIVQCFQIMDICYTRGGHSYSYCQLPSIKKHETGLTNDNLKGGAAYIYAQGWGDYHVQIYHTQATLQLELQSKFKKIAAVAISGDWLIAAGKTLWKSRNITTS